MSITAGQNFGHKFTDKKLLYQINNDFKEWDKHKQKKDGYYSSLNGKQLMKYVEPDQHICAMKQHMLRHIWPNKFNVLKRKEKHNNS